MSEPKYQMTYMKGPINVTVRLDEREDVVKRVEELVEDARTSLVLNPVETSVVKPVTATPYQPAPVKDINEGTKCRNCGANRVNNPKTGKWFCEKKCWL